ncbi:MAG: hypothetical protein KIA10_03185 [Enterococcus faecium]|uniref:hypothetical protein n=1 Tax=Enterococcus faecium TaxID=1352 RepID=UPI000CF08CD2|nr:hypothetical protein [Enterococcus faecium]EGP5630559.1 hypothetical protein [Enterococcus faecium]MBS6010668.1 hypothetical protein [Enterococcus faecium]PQC81333.1 hypothetical protein CUM69_04650 [Enterococcus faecium]
MRKQVNFSKEGIIVIFGVILYLQNWLITQNEVWGYMDELVAVIFLMYYFFSNRILKKDVILIILAMITILSGISFNLIFGIQTYWLAITEDILSLYKFLFVYLGMKTYLEKKGVRVDRILKIVCPILKIYLIVLFIFTIANLVTNIEMSSEVRYGLKNFAFIYGTPGHIINQMTYSILLLYGEREYIGRKNTLFIGLTLLVMLATLKTRAIILTFLFLALYYFFAIKKKKRIGLEISTVIIAIVLLGISQFEYYFLSEGAPRQMFVAGAVKLVKEYFPFGTGFATYGSSAAADFYSPLYYLLGFSNRWGMTETNQLFLNDNYLPMIFGEFGIVVALLFLLLIYIYCKRIIKASKETNSINIRLITYFFIGDIVLSSIQSSYLAHYSIVTLSFFYFLLFYRNRKMAKK